MPAGGPLARRADLRGTDELDLREVGDPLAPQLSPGAPRRGRVEDHGHAGFGQKLGGERQSPMDDLFLSLGGPLASRNGAAGESQVQDRRGYGLGREKLRDP